MDDIESQDSETHDLVECERVFVPMNAKQRKLWEVLCGTRPVTEIQRSRHYHPILAGMRFAAEYEACGYLQKHEECEYLVDVGGAPKRTGQYLGNKGWFICPDIQVGDARRREQCPQALLPQMCGCLFQECDHIFCRQGSCDIIPSDLPRQRSELTVPLLQSHANHKLHTRVPCAFLFVHSAYYIEPAFLWAAIYNAGKPNPCYVVGHDFAEPFGAFYDEATWVAEGDEIVMRVEGQKYEPYRHPLLPWASGWRGEGGEYFEVETLRCMGSFTYLWRVRAKIGPPRSAPRMLEDVTVDEPFVGPVRFSAEQKGRIQSNGRVDQYVFDLDHVYRAGSVLYTDGAMFGQRRVKVTIPVTMMARATNLCVGRPRDAALLSDVTNMLKRVADVQRVPPEKQTEMVIFAANLGFVKHINQELDALNTITGRFGVQMAALNDLLAFRSFKPYNCCTIFCYGIVGLVIPGAITSIILSSAHVHGWPLDVSVIWAVIFVVLLIWYCCAFCCHRGFTAYDNYSLRNWRANYEEDRTISLPPNRHIPVVDRVLPGSVNSAPLPVDPLRQGATITRLPPREREEVGRRIDRAHIAGLCPDTVTVNVLEPTQDVEESFLRNRLFVDRPQWNSSVVATVCDWFSELKERFNPVLDWSENGFNQWIKSQKGKQNADVIKKWTDLRVALAGHFPTIIRNSAKTFTKLEKSSKFVTREGQKPVKPRGIAPPSDEHKVLLGPVISQLYKAFTSLFKPGEQTVYCSGLTTDAIGRDVDDFIDMAGGEGAVMGVWIDCSSYDACLGWVQQWGYLCFLKDIGFPPEAIQLLTETKLKGTTSQGVQFFASETYWEDDFTSVLFGLFIGWCNNHGVKNEVSYDEGRRCRKVFLPDGLAMWSGRMDTNLADTAILIAVMETFLESVGIKVFKLLVCGDDSFLLVKATEWNAELFKLLCEWFEGFGLKPDGGFSVDRWKWEFCSKLFWFGVNRKSAQSQTVLGPKVGRTMARFGLTVSVPTETNIAGAANSLRRDASHVPLVRVLAQRTFEICRDQRIRVKAGRSEWDPMHASEMYDCDPRNYTLLERRYGITRRDEDLYYQLLSTYQSVPSFYHWEDAERLAKADE